MDTDEEGDLLGTARRDDILSADGHAAGHL